MKLFGAFSDSEAADRKGSLQQGRPYGHSGSYLQAFRGLDADSQYEANSGAA
jgi:hypothetical protein